MTEKIKSIENIIIAAIEYQKNKGDRYCYIPFTAEESEIILAALSVYRRKWEEVKEKEKKDAQSGTT